MAQDLYKNIKVSNNKKTTKKMDPVTTSLVHRGLSTVNPDSNSSTL